MGARKDIPEDLQVSMANEYMSGVSSSAIRLKYRVSVPTILYAVRRRGGKVRSRGSPSRISIGDVSRLCASGDVDQEHAAAHFNVSTMTMRNVVKRNGYKNWRTFIASLKRGGPDG